MIPVIALVGRPNVGKSTLFNRLTKTRDALVANLSGLTRDRQYGESHYLDRYFMVIDTGGISGDEEGIDSAMAEQSLLAIEEADMVLFIVDTKAGLTGADSMIAKHLRKTNKKTFVVANKVDGVDIDIALSDFYAMGLGDIYPTTATHGRGVRSLMEAVLADVPEKKDMGKSGKARGTKIGVIGRPNVGKSTLVNRMLGEDRVVVYDEPGTTRDSIYIEYMREDKQYTIIDTAGIRRRKNIKEAVEKFSIVKTLQAITDAHVVILLMDAKEGIVDQDLHLMGTVIQAGRALVLGLNKWDGMTQDQKDRVKKELNRRLQFIDYVDIHFISALHGSGVGKLYGSIDNAFRSATEKFQTRMLTQLLEDAIQDHQPPMINGRRIKLRYAHLGGSNPPIIVIHGNQTEKIPSSYVKYLEKVFRRELKLVGTPVKIEFKSGENPYSGRKNKMGTNQVSKKERFSKRVIHSKSKKKHGA